MTSRWKNVYRRDPQRTCDRHRRKVAAGLKRPGFRTIAKARLPMLFTELIPLTRKGKGPGRETDLLSPPSC